MVFGGGLGPCFWRGLSTRNVSPIVSVPPLWVLWFGFAGELSGRVADYDMFGTIHNGGSDHRCRLF